MEGIATPECGLVRDDRVFWNFFDYLFFNAELVLAHSAEGALEIVADFFPLLALFFFIKDPAANVADIFHWDFLLIIGLLEVTLKQALQCLAVAGLVAGHLVDGLSVLIGYPFAWGLRNIILLVICELLCNSGKSPVHFLISF